MFLIQLNSVTKTYKMGDEEIRALDNVNLLVREGEFLAVMGPSGSGKSTLANIIGGLDSPSAGEVLIDSENLAKKRDKELSAYRNKKIGFIFQTFNLQPTYNAVENVEVPLIFSKISPKIRRGKAIECLTLVGLSDRMKHKPNQLSGGQRQRVCIARALANDPEIIIADEPTGNLDTKKGKEIMQLLADLNKKKGITLVVITHDQTVASMAHRIIKIQDGVLR